MYYFSKGGIVSAAMDVNDPNKDIYEYFYSSLNEWWIRNSLGKWREIHMGATLPKPVKTAALLLGLELPE